MITWTHLPAFAISVAVLSIVAALCAWCNRRRQAIVVRTLSMVVMGCFIGLLWYSLSRPPMRTMGETRLWYSFFMLAAGLVVYIRYRYRWIFSFSALMSIVFLAINCFKPELHDRTLMPALQSVWFIPHVTVYMMAYAVLACTTITSISASLKNSVALWRFTDSLVYAGVSFLTIGMFTGAIWAKQAWGNYWSWDPKETWALATWMIYLLYIHWRRYGSARRWLLCGILLAAFVALQMCWWGIDYLPSAQHSVHIYNR